MLTPKYMKDLPKELVEYFNELENKILKDLVSRINDIDELPGTATNRIETMLNLGYDIKDILEEINKYTDIGEKKLNKLINDAGLLSYANDVKSYKVGNKILKNYEENSIVNNMVKSYQKQGINDLNNITKTIGFNNMPLEKYYKKKLSQAIIDINSGAFSKQEVIRSTINELGNKGIRVINYKDRNYTLESAVRICINSTVNKMSSAMGLQNAEDMEQDLMELTAHMGARPSHADWQGKIVSLSGRSGCLTVGDIGLGDAGGFLGIHCRHNWYPFFEGISKRAYTDEELKHYDPEPIRYEGKTYTYYEAGQRQRQIERSIRQSKRKLIMYEEVKDEERYLTESVKLQRKRQEYKKFSNAINIRENAENTTVLGYNRSKSSKATWSNKKLEQEANRIYNLGSNKANVDAYLKDKHIRDFIKNNPDYQRIREKQDNHLNNMDNIIKKSQFINSKEDIEEIIKKHMGNGEIYDKRKEYLKELIFDEKLRGYIFDDITNTIIETSKGSIHYSKYGVHLVPSLRTFKELRKWGNLKE